MCIIAFQYKTNPVHELIIAANRDEIYERPSKPVYLWRTTPAILAGQDEQLGGTWMGVTENGRFAAITNYRDPLLNVLKPISRGKIATDFLVSSESASATVEQLRQTKDDVAPYNVLLYDGMDFLHYNNFYNQMTVIEPGTYTLCNDTFNTPWPKTVTLQADFEAVLSNVNWTDEDLFSILRNTATAPDNMLPSTGVPFDIEKALSAIFVKLPHYGTRSSAVIQINAAGAHFSEQTYLNGELNTKTKQYIGFKKIKTANT